ncbi:MAG: TonB-dependent receptor [Phenylobacterium sp.]|uniref:TonB-dependent receptor n=1 Tax=Phenylobacterium sp. TaxID=1871053 RepID=UPI00391C5E4F
MTEYSRLRSLLVLGVSTVAMAAVAAPAFAQETMLEELVITAEKREQSLQDVPVAVTAYTSERRDVLGVATVEDFARITPSVTYTNNDRLSIRGFGRLTNSIGTDPSVALYSDGIFSNSMADSSTPSLFIDRTEILRGPQGTLYGRNSIGGTLNVISKRPSHEFEAEVRGMAGNYEAWRTDALVSGPITDNLRFLVGGSLERRGEGYIENVGPGGDTAGLERYMIEAQIEADLGDNITARLRYSKFDWDDSYGVGNTFLANVTPFDTTSVVGSGTSALYYNTAYGYSGSNPMVQDPYKINTNYTAIGKLSNHDRLHFDMTWDLGWATLKYLAGYQAYTYDTGGDSDQTPRTATQSVNTGFGFTATGVSTDARTFYQERQKWWSNEVNLSSNSDGPLQWIVGLYQYQQQYDQPQGIRVVGDPAMMAPLTLTGAAADPNPSGAFLSVNGHLDTKSYAAFGQIDYDFAETWKLTAGLRYTYDEKDGYDTARYVARLPTLALALAGAGVPISVAQGLAVDITALQVCGGPTIASCAANAATADLYPNVGGGLRRDLSGDWDALTGTLGVQWTPDTDTNLYLRYSRGYKSGGWLGSNGLTPNPYADPEYVDSYEFGAKKTFGGRLQVNTALFYSDYQGFQTPLTVALGTITASTFLNLDAKVWGLELESLYSPVRNLQLMLNYAYLNTEITKGCCFVDTADPAALAAGARPVGAAVGGRVSQDLVGNQMPMAPENKVTVGATYTWEFGPGSLIASGTYTYTDDQQSTIFANPLYTAPANEIADFRVLWKDIDDRYTLIGFVKNAFDEVAYQRSVANPTSPTAAGPRREVILNMPRTFGVEVQYRF